MHAFSLEVYTFLISNQEQARVEQANFITS